MKPLFLNIINNGHYELNPLWLAFFIKKNDSILFKINFFNYFRIFNKCNRTLFKKDYGN